MKKQIMSIVLAVSMIASLFAVFMLPAVAKQGDIVRDVFVTDGTIVVDGKRDVDYLSSSVIKSIYKIKDTGNTSLKFEGYSVATTEGFYFWLEIIGDTTYVNTGDTNLHDYGGNNRDYLQVYYNMSAAGKTDYIGYIMHDYRNNVYFRNPTGSNAPGYTYTAPTGFQSAAVKTETGWISEMFIPWTDGTPAKAGMSAGDLSTAFYIGFQYNDDYDGNNDYNCAVYDDSTTSYWSDYTLMPKVSFVRNFNRLSSTTAFMDGDIALDYTASFGSSDISTVYARYTISGKNGVESHNVQGILIDPMQDTYRFTFNLAPYRLNDTVKVELTRDGKVIHDLPAYTVRDLCIAAINSSKEDLGMTDNQKLAAANLATALLNFGAMSQKFVGHDVDNLVNKGYEEDFKDIEIKFNDIVVSKKAEGFNNVDLVSYSLYFDGETRFEFKVKADKSLVNNLYLSVYEGVGSRAVYIPFVIENYDEETGIFSAYSYAIDPADYDFDYQVRLEYVENPTAEWPSYKIVQSVQCNVNAYLAKIVATSTNPDMVALAKAAYTVGHCADNMLGA